MHLILTGATGLVGSGVLDAMVKMKDVTKISILSRRPVKMAEDVKDPRVNVIIHKDFGKYDSAVLSQLRGATGCVWALGVSQTQVGKEEYVKITKDYALAASQAFKTLATEEEPFNFVYVSGYGATTTPGPLASIFARIKGETELELAKIRRENPLFHASSVRAGFVDAATHEAIKPYLPQQPIAIKALGFFLATPIRNLYRSIWSPTQDLGLLLTEMAMGKYKSRLPETSTQGIEVLPGGFPILENQAFGRLAGFGFGSK